MYGKCPKISQKRYFRACMYGKCPKISKKKVSAGHSCMINVLKFPKKGVFRACMYGKCPKISQKSVFRTCMYGKCPKVSYTNLCDKMKSANSADLNQSNLTRVYIILLST